MDPRLYIAAHALQGMLADPNVGGSYEDLALRAVEFADALLAELRKTSPAAAASTSATPPAETAARGQEGPRNG